MFGRLKELLQTWKARRKLEKDMAPEHFLRLADEVRQLVEVAERTCPEERDIRTRLRAIQKEMDALAELAAREDFRKLSTGRKLLLRQGMLQTRDQLLNSMNAAPAPTDRLQ